MYQYFDIEDNAIVEVDFNDRITKERDILEAALKKPAVETISAYLEGKENDPNFTIDQSYLAEIIDKIF